MGWIDINHQCRSPNLINFYILFKVIRDWNLNEKINAENHKEARALR